MSYTPDSTISALNQAITVTIPKQTLALEIAVLDFKKSLALETMQMYHLRHGIAKMKWRASGPKTEPAMAKVERSKGGDRTPDEEHDVMHNNIEPIEEYDDSFNMIRAVRSGALTNTLALLAVASLVVPVAALDNALVPLGDYPTYPTYPMANPVETGRISGLTAGPIGGCILLLIGYLSVVVKSVLGPVMGISSVLWFIMRNDAAVRPGLAWIVFAIWAVVTLMYLSYQCSRAAHHKIYILLSLAFSGVCLCIVALVQKSSIQGGLVTAIPPCTSFAAYAVAFFFPDRRSNIQVGTV